MKSRCDNCAWLGEPDITLTEIPNLSERLDVGGIVPSGECPECGALCYELNLEHLSGIHIEGREWHRRGVGGMYTRAHIYHNGVELTSTEVQAGSGGHYITLALMKLKEIGYDVDIHGDTRYLRETLHATCSLVAVGRERDL